MTDNEIQEMFEAFNRHDTDAVMTFFHDDIVFEIASGPVSYGTRFEGKEAVRKQFENTWGSMPDVRWLGGNHYVSGSVITTEATFVATQSDGKRIHVDQLDLLTIKDGKIVRKQAFRKNRPLLDPV
jgi:taurine dehydrogenase small subunit